MSFEKIITLKGKEKRWRYNFGCPEFKDEAEREYESIKRRPKSQEEFTEMIDKIDKALELVIAKDKAYKLSKKMQVETEKSEKQKKREDSEVEDVEEDEDDEDEVEKEIDSESSFDTNSIGSSGSDRFSMPMASCPFNIHEREEPNWNLMRLFVRTKIDFSDVKLQEGYENNECEFGPKKMTKAIENRNEKLSDELKHEKSSKPEKNMSISEANVRVRTGPSEIDLAKMIRSAVLSTTSVDIMKTDLELTECKPLWEACTGDLLKYMGLVDAITWNFDESQKALLSPLLCTPTIFSFHYNLSMVINMAREYLTQEQRNTRQ
jgi:hypothetical protein